MGAGAYIIFCVCLIAAFFVRRKLIHWRTITILGFFIDTPELYYRYPLVYNCVSWLLIFVLMMVVSSDFSFWIRISLFVIAVLIADLAGKVRALDDYRRNLREMLAEDDLDAERRETISRDLSKSDSQLLQEKRKIYRLMSGKF